MLGLVENQILQFIPGIMPQEKRLFLLATLCCAKGWLIVIPHRLSLFFFPLTLTLYFLYPKGILFVLTLLYLGNISTSSQVERPDVLLHSFSMLPTASLIFVCDLVNDLGSSAGSSILQNTCPCFFTYQHYILLSLGNYFL